MNKITTYLYTLLIGHISVASVLKSFNKQLARLEQVVEYRKNAAASCRDAAEKMMEEAKEHDAEVKQGQKAAENIRKLLGIE